MFAVLTPSLDVNTADKNLNIHKYSQYILLMLAS